MNRMRVRNFTAGPLRAYEGLIGKGLIKGESDRIDQGI